jgi:hypothetical protein
MSTPVNILRAGRRVRRSAQPDNAGNAPTRFFQLSGELVVDPEIELS